MLNFFKNFAVNTKSLTAREQRRLPFDADAHCDDIWNDYEEKIKGYKLTCEGYTLLSTSFLYNDLGYTIN